MYSPTTDRTQIILDLITGQLRETTTPTLGKMELETFMSRLVELSTKEALFKEEEIVDGVIKPKSRFY